MVIPEVWPARDIADLAWVQEQVRHCIRWNHPAGILEQHPVMADPVQDDFFAVLDNDAEWGLDNLYRSAQVLPSCGNILSFFELVRAFCHDAMEPVGVSVAKLVLLAIHCVTYLYKFSCLLNIMPARESDLSSECSHLAMSKGVVRTCDTTNDSHAEAFQRNDEDNGQSKGCVCIAEQPVQTLLKLNRIIQASHMRRDLLRLPLKSQMSSVV